MQGEARLLAITSMWGNSRPAKRSYRDGRGLATLSMHDGRLKWAVGALSLLGLGFNHYIAPSLGSGGALSHATMVAGLDGCFPVTEQKQSLAPVAGSYDVLVLSRWSLNGLCAVRGRAHPACRLPGPQGQPAAAAAPLPADDVTTVIRGLWPVRSACHEEDPGNEAHQVTVAMPPL